MSCSADEPGTRLSQRTVNGHPGLERQLQEVQLSFGLETLAPGTEATAAA